MFFPFYTSSNNTPFENKYAYSNSFKARSWSTLNNQSFYINNNTYRFARTFRFRVFSLQFQYAHANN